MDELVLNWTKELEWEENPFKKDTVDPAFLGGYEKERERLNLLLLKEAPLATIIGQEGMGKTMLLNWFTGQLDKHPERFTYSCLTKNDLADDKFVQSICAPLIKKHKLLNLFKKEEKITRKNITNYITQNSAGKRFLLLIDDAHQLSKEDYEVLESLNTIPQVSIILSGKSVEKEKIKAKDNLSIELKKMDFVSGREMLKKRIEAVGGDDIWPFNDKMLKDIFGLGDYMPKKILTLCQERAKELAIDVKRGKIKRPNHKLIKFEHEEHPITYEDHPIEHPPVEKKHKDDGFVLKFTFKDDETPLKKIDQEQMAAPPTTEDTKTTTEDTKKKESPAKEESKTPIKEQEDVSIDINLGYDEKPPKKEAKPKKIEPFEIDIKPKKKK